MKNDMWKAILTIFVAIGLAGVTAFAQQGEFSDVVETVVVEVPVQVIDGGQPVRGLGRENFEILDGRRQQEITGFEVIDLEQFGLHQQEAVRKQPPIAARRHFLFLFDLSFADPSAITRARGAATDVMANELHDSDLVGVATYAATTGPRLVLGFTPDRQQARLAIETLGLSQMVEQVPDPLGLVLTRPGLVTTGGGGGGGGPGGGEGLDREAIFTEMITEFSQETQRLQREVQKGQMMALANGLSDLATVMSSVQGRKYVVFLSEGIDSQIFLGTEDQERTQEMAEASGSGEFWKIDSDERFGSSATLGVLEDMFETFRRADAQIQAVDVAGLRAGSAGQRATGQDTLFMMANETGGELYSNFSNLGEAMGEMLDRTSVTYMLAFQPDKLKLEGEYHKLKVRLKGGPSKARVIHRPGYFEPKPFAMRTRNERRLEAAEMIVGGEEGGALESSVLASPFPVTGQRAYVPVLVEVDGNILLAAATGGQAALEVYGYAIDTEGTVADYFAQSFAFELAKVEEALRKTGIKFFGDLELAPGEYVVRVLNRDPVSGRTSLVSVPLTVPTFDGQQATLSPPFFVEPPGKWLTVLEQEQPGKRTGRDVDYPFLAEGNPYIPASKPVVDGGAEVRLVAFSLPEQDFSLRVSVLGADGQPVRGAGGLSDERRALDEASGRTDIAVRFDPGELPAGEYLLVVDLESGGEQLNSSLPFVVSGS